MTLGTEEDTLICRRKLETALSGGIVLVKAVDLSSDRLLMNECNEIWRLGNIFLQ
jgi:hypothetical protein